MDNNFGSGSENNLGELPDENTCNSAGDGQVDTMVGPSEEGVGTADENVLVTQNRSLPLKSRIEALIFGSQTPLNSDEIILYLGGGEENDANAVLDALDQLVEEYNKRSGGFQLCHNKRSGYQFRTIEAAAIDLERMFASKPKRLTKASLETLAIIAYRQPVTRAEIDFIRGVDCGSIIKTLIERGLVTCVGRKADMGRPMLFGTTNEFLNVFSLGSTKELPPLESFQPAMEILKTAREQLEGGEDVDIETFIGDKDAVDATDVAAEDDPSSEVLLADVENHIDQESFELLPPEPNNGDLNF